MKVVDNLQITIKNIHIRFEDTILNSTPYSFGITLKEFSAHTCDEQWQPVFLDRT